MDNQTVLRINEVVAVAPGLPGGLAGLLGQLDARQRVVRCAGYEVVHRRDAEPPLRWGEPLLAQRGSWSPTVHYSKPALASAPLR